MNMAWNLVDKGYDVKIFEKENFIGGHCNTYRFVLDGEPGWEDCGVIGFTNTSNANELGLGPWLIDMVGIIERFAGNNSAIPLQYLNLDVYELNFKTGENFGQFIPNYNAEFYAAYAKMVNIIMTKYPWIDTMIDSPSPLPSELTVSLTEWLENNNLTVLNIFFNETIWLGGSGSFDQITALEALNNVATPSDFLASSFSVFNGCYSIYEGIEKYIGSDKILLNTKIIAAIRNYLPNEQSLLFSETNGVLNYDLCDKIIVAFPPTQKNTLPLFLDFQESSLFSTVSTVNVLTAAFNVSTSLEGRYFLSNTDKNRVNNQPQTPSVITIGRDHDIGPYCSISFAQYYKSEDFMKNLTKQTIENIPKVYFTNPEFQKFWVHDYTPKFSFVAQQANISPFKLMDNLQGHRNTYWVGALRTTYSSTQIWNENKRLIDLYF